MRKRRRNKLPIIAAVVVIVIIGIIFLVKRYTPSKQWSDYINYFGYTSEEEVAIVIQGEKLEAKAFVADGEVYVPVSVIREKIDNGFFFDANENVLSYVLPKDIVSVSVGSTDYYVSKTRNTEGYQILKADAADAYIALDFVKKYADIEFNYFESPKRVSINNKWTDLDVATVKKDTEVRHFAGVKSDILTEVKKGDRVILIEEEGSWEKVFTADGFVGYLKANKLTDIRKEEVSREFTAPEFTHISKNYTINMAWNQMFSEAANEEFLSDIAKTKGVNVVSPTWFELGDDDGNLNSIASDSYVNYAHQAGKEVWGMVTNIGEDYSAADRSFNVLTFTSKRERLENQLIAAAIQYNLDGICIDFEELNLATGDAFIEFIKELSVKCRNNGLVLSVADYIPSEFTEFYDREAQAKYADYVVLMGYDEHINSSEEAGSVASIGYVKEAVRATLEEVPANQLILGIPFYSRLWGVNESGGVEEVYVYGMEDMNDILARNGVTATWDDETKQNYAQYPKNGLLYKVWLEDSRSIEEKLKVMKENNLAGVAEWKLGLEDPVVWDTILKYVN